MSDHKFNATLKAAQGYDAPWLTIGADSPDELRANLAGFAGLDANTDAAALGTAGAAKLQSFWTAEDTRGAQGDGPPQSFPAVRQKKEIEHVCTPPAGAAGAEKPTRKPHAR